MRLAARLNLSQTLTGHQLAEDTAMGRKDRRIIGKLGSGCCPVPI